MDKFAIRREVNRMAALFSMPADTKAPAPANELEQMRLWINDPILRQEAEQRAIDHGWEIIYSEYGIPIDISPAKEDVA